MRTVENKPLNELIRIIRKYWETGDTDFLEIKITRAKELSMQAFGNDAKWLAFSDFAFGIIRLDPSISNTKIQLALELAGISVEEGQK